MSCLSKRLDFHADLVKPLLKGSLSRKHTYFKH